MKMKLQINFKVQILLLLIAGVTASFLQVPSNQFQSTLNSTFLTHRGKLHRPIVIPNSTENTYASESNLQLRTTDKTVLKNILQNEDYSGEEFKANERFSSRYSSKEQMKADDSDEKVTSITDIPVLLERGEPISSKISLPSPPNAKSFNDRSDIADDSEEEKADGSQYLDSSEAREKEESEITSTTNEPYELRTVTSIRTSPDEHFENYETSSGVADEIDDSEEKTSPDDYHDSGSKNYHSIQTPLNQIKYRGHAGDLKKIAPNGLRLIKHNWPYTREKLQTELEENEISDEENKGLETEEWTRKKQITPNRDLERAVHKDENRFNRTRPYVDERKRRKEEKRKLAKEEEKDHRSPFYKALKQFTVDEETTEKFAKVPKKKHFGAQPTKKPKNIFFNYTPETTGRKLNNSKELMLDFPVHQFLGPVVFDKDTSKAQSSPKTAKPYNSHRNYIKILAQKEKLERNSQRFQKEGKYQSFNHLEESDKMYNAILANIQSVFGLRTQPLRAGNGGRNQPEVNLEESSAFTWSVPLIKRQKKPYPGVLESVTLKGSDGEMKSGSEGAVTHRKSAFPADITQPE